MEAKDLSKLGHEFEVFKSENFTGKTIQKIKFNNIHFIECDFTGALITSCEFNQKCLFKKCKFNGTSFLNVKFNESDITECTFEKNILNDVIIDSNSTFERNDFIGEDFQVNNFWLRGEKIDEISKLISVVEVVEEQIDDPLRANRDLQDNKEVKPEEYERDTNLDEDMKLYNVLYPAVMKQYPDLKKTDGSEEYVIYVNDIEFAFAKDESVWRAIFFIRDTDDIIGSMEVDVPYNQVITYDTCAEAFKNCVKALVTSLMKTSQSEVIKNSLKEFIKIVFKETNIVTENINFATLVFVASENPDEVVGTFNCGYDFETKELVTIIGQPFKSNDTLVAKKTKNFIKENLGFSIRDDYMSENYDTEVQQTYANEYPYSCYVTKPSPICTTVYLKPFGKGNIVLLKN